MSVNRCEGCSTAYAIGLPSCPQCGSTASHEIAEGEVYLDMAKIRANGPNPVTDKRTYGAEGDEAETTDSTPASSTDTSSSGDSGSKDNTAKSPDVKSTSTKTTQASKPASTEKK